MILICGTSGTGKTELAKRLKEYGFKVIHLPELVIREKLYLNYDEERQSYVIDPQKVIKRIVELERKSSEPLVVEGIGAEIIPSKYVDLCIVLICEPRELRRRLRLKGFPDEKIEENLEAERLSLIWGEALDKYGNNKVVVLDTTNIGVDDLVKIVLEELKKRGLFWRDSDEN